MGFKCGIVGLPNVGKSTLFNALTKTAAAQAANYPFCTIEPNTGEVAVPDPRLKKIAAAAGSKEIIPTRISFVDIAGLVRGASKGEGLGNQFLANIREVDAIVHVLRCFEDDDITHVEGRIDPVADAETVETELMLADLDSLERRIVNVRKRAQAKDKESLTANDTPVLDGKWQSFSMPLDFESRFGYSPVAGSETKGDLSERAKSIVLEGWDGTGVGEQWAAAGRADDYVAVDGTVAHWRFGSVAEGVVDESTVIPDIAGDSPMYRSAIENTDAPEKLEDVQVSHFLEPQPVGVQGHRLSEQAQHQEGEDGEGDRRWEPHVGPAPGRPRIPRFPRPPAGLGPGRCAPR